MEVRCGVALCRKLLFMVSPSTDFGLRVEKACRGLHDGVACGLTNRGIVTDRPGTPVADALPDPWECSRCGHHLGRVHPVKGRLTVRCRCGAKVAVTAAQAVRAMQDVARAS